MKKIILDTDFNTDVDDLIAVRVLSYFERKGEAELLCACFSSNAVSRSGKAVFEGAAALDAALTYEGLPGVPIGRHSGKEQGSFYYPVLYEYPHTLNGFSECEDSVRLYRRALASLEKNEKATVVCIGYLCNLAGVLKSQADDLSPLDGVSLMREKVETLYLMGGRYDIDATSPETNLSNGDIGNVEASATVFRRFDGQIVLIGQELGSVLSCRCLIDRNKTDDMLYRSLRAYFSGRRGYDCVEPRCSWDPLTALVAIRGAKACGFEEVRGENRMIVDKNNPYYGCNRFTPSENGRHTYLKRLYTDDYYTEMLDKIILKEGWGAPSGLPRTLCRC